MLFLLASGPHVRRLTKELAYLVSVHLLPCHWACVKPQLRETLFLANQSVCESAFLLKGLENHGKSLGPWGPMP